MLDSFLGVHTQRRQLVADGGTVRRRRNDYPRLAGRQALADEAGDCSGERQLSSNKQTAWNNSARRTAGTSSVSISRFRTTADAPNADAALTIDASLYAVAKTIRGGSGRAR